MSASATSPSANRIVLVVDDEPASQRAIRRALSDEGRVLTAASAAEGLGVLTNESVALVVTDQRMPGMNGTDFLREAVRHWPGVIRIVLTAYADSDTLLDAINGGQVFFFLTKPWQPHELRLVVRRGLERYEAEAERAVLLRDLETSYERVRREADQKGRLLAMTAHELGTPVHIMLNAIELLRDTDLPEPAQSWARMAADAAGWMARGLAQIRNATVVREATFRAREEAVDLGRVVSETVTEIRHAASARSLLLETIGVDASVVVPGDRRWLSLALWNLVSNAVRFTPDGGAISIEVERHATGAMVSVRDTGIGIAADHLAEIFEPFSNAGGDVGLHGSGLFTFRSRGLGLGMAIVREIVKAHAGTIDVASREGEGCTVRVHLPSGQDPDTGSSAPSAPNDLSG